MDTPSPSVRDLARRLVAAEAAIQSAAEPHVQPAVRVCEKLRVSLTRFAGVDGFAVLLRRRWLWPGRKFLRCTASRRRLTAPWKDSKSSSLMRATPGPGGATRQSRSPSICSGYWLRSSANRSRCASRAKLGPTHRWTNKYCGIEGTP